MGLDNGISRANTTKGKDIYGCYNEEYDVCYWRKWWGFRDSVVDMLWEKNKNVDCSEVELDDSDLIDIIDILDSLDEENWESPIWSWEEVEDQIPGHIKSIQELIKEKEENPNIVAIFYDSY